MTDLYLIAHKVHGAPAFDIAHRLPCPECSGMGCLECDDLGYWWIVPTSGHRAYPYHYWPWDELACDSRRSLHEFTPVPIQFGSMPPNLPDHYTSVTSPTIKPPSLLDRLNLRPALPKIVRRI